MTTSAPRTLTITSQAPGYSRNRRPTVATHLLTNELPGVVVGTACGRVFALARTSGLTLDTNAPVTCQACTAGKHFDPRPNARAPRD